MKASGPMAHALANLLTLALMLTGIGCIRVQLDPIDVKLDVNLSVETQLKEAMTPEMRERFEERLPELSEARKAGRVGETFDGYVEAVTPVDLNDPKLSALIKAENADRLAYYQAVARATQANVSYVSEISGMKRFEAAASGEFLRHREGIWKQKTSATTQP